MLRAYVECPVGNDTDAIGEHLEFMALPREGETIEIAYPEYHHEVRVLKISHRTLADNDVIRPVSWMTLTCEYVRCVEYK